MCQPTVQAARSLLSLQEKRALKKIYVQLGLTNKIVQDLEKNGLLHPKSMEKYIHENEGSTKIQAFKANFNTSRLIPVSDFMSLYYEHKGTYKPLVNARWFWELYAEYLEYHWRQAASLLIEDEQLERTAQELKDSNVNHQTELPRVTKPEMARESAHHPKTDDVRTSSMSPNKETKKLHKTTTKKAAKPDPPGCYASTLDTLHYCVREKGEKNLYPNKKGQININLFKIPQMSKNYPGKMEGSLIPNGKNQDGTTSTMDLYPIGDCQNASPVYLESKKGIPNSQKEINFRNSRNAAKIKAQSKFLRNLIKSEIIMDSTSNSKLSMTPSTLIKGKVSEKCDNELQSKPPKLENNIQNINMGKCSFNYSTQRRDHCNNACPSITKPNHDADSGEGTEQPLKPFRNPANLESTKDLPEEKGTNISQNIFMKETDREISANKREYPNDHHHPDLQDPTPIPEKETKEPSMTKSSTMELWAPAMGNEIILSKFPITLVDFAKDNYLTIAYVKSKNTAHSAAKTVYKLFEDNISEQKNFNIDLEEKGELQNTFIPTIDSGKKRKPQIYLFNNPRYKESSQAKTPKTYDLEKKQNRDPIIEYYHQNKALSAVKQ